MGLFPAFVAGGEHTVAGEVYEVDQVTLASLDRLEGHPDFYQRTCIALADGRRVDTYLCTPHEVINCPIIESGSWRAYCKERRA